MTWTNPPQTIIDWRDALLACPTIQALLTGLSLSNQQARFHYPFASVADMQAGLPMWVLAREDQEYQRLTATGSLGSGTVVALGYFDASSDIGTVESQVAVAQELCELGLAASFLYITKARVAKSSAPNAAQLAGADAGQTRTSVPGFTISYSAEWEG